MKIVTISDTYIQELASRDSEFMYKHGRPCIIVIKLKFRGKRRDFAVPLRSNISPTVPKWQYFPLPPRPTTKPFHRHGIHYIKMFPINKTYQNRFRIEGNQYYQNIQKILNRHEKEIISSCQNYLESYEKEGKPSYAVDLDLFVVLLKEQDE